MARSPGLPINDSGRWRPAIRRAVACSRSGVSLSESSDNSVNQEQKKTTVDYLYLNCIHMKCDKT